jgi:hypothetical protein
VIAEGGEGTFVMGQDGKSTGKYRAKRPDLRANAKKRQAEKTKAYEAKEGVTYAAKKKAKLAAAAAGAPPEKERKFTDAVRVSHLTLPNYTMVAFATSRTQGHSNEPGSAG